MPTLPHGRPSFPRVFLFAILAVLTAQVLFTACVEKKTDDIDTSENTADDTGSGGTTICGSSFETDILPFFENYCLRCHSAERTGAQRGGAPDGVNFDTLDDVKAHVEELLEKLLDDSGMPPSAPFPLVQERDTLISWLDCAVEVDWQAQ